jgi:hypothetical protein
LSVDGVERVGKGEGFKAGGKAEHAWNEARKKKKTSRGDSRDGSKKERLKEKDIINLSCLSIFLSLSLSHTE